MASAYAATTHMSYYQNYEPHVNTMHVPCREDLLHAARGVLRSDVLYDPEDSDMSMSADERFRLHVSLGLWQIALQQGISSKPRYLDFY